MTATEYPTGGWWTEEHYKAFVDVYGYDVTTWHGFETLQTAHELKMTTWLMQNLEESHEIAARDPATANAPTGKLACDSHHKDSLRNPFAT